MSSDLASGVAISVEKIGKRYRTGATGGIARYRSLREEVSRPLRRRRLERAREQEFWALKDVSFQIQAGETVGVIGRNGAGKSTLLKLLAQITPPTEGRGTTFGRVGSLLEVGTGFHPELTGRENILLSAAIMGMGRSEAQARFDEIVEFSETGAFLDTPVKRYSSGMYMRLAFSVAAHLEPEILLVDEVLAVGDGEFQRKCLGRMEDLSGTGRTVVFVSHNMQSVVRLCPRVLLLDGGSLVVDGGAREIVEAYLGRDGGGATREWAAGDAAGDDRVRLRSIRVVAADGQPGADVDIRSAVDVEVEYLRLTDDASFTPLVELRFVDAEGITLFLDRSIRVPTTDDLLRKGVVRARCRIPGNLLAEGIVFTHVALTGPRPGERIAMERDAVAFHITDRSTGDGVRGTWTGRWPGVVRPMLDWQVQRTGDL